MKAVFLDRDGTIVDVVRDEETGVISTAFHPSHLRLLPGVVSGLRRLKDAGYLLAIATNQPGPAKGFYSTAAVERTHEALVELLAGHGITIAAIRACLHYPEKLPGGDPALIGPCSCRKPKPGLLTSLLDHFGLSPKDCWMVGDNPADVLAGQAALMRTGLVFPRNRCELCQVRNGPDVSPDVVAATFEEVSEKILFMDDPSPPTST